MEIKRPFPQIASSFVASGGADKHFVHTAGADDFVNQWKNGCASAIDHALPADLKHSRVWQDAKVGSGLGRREKPRVGQRALHQQGLKL